MARRKNLRKIVAPPGFKGYKPYGTSKKKAQAIDLLYEEYESLKLTDYDSMNHLEASQLMGISRPTFARIYESARKKIAQAFVESREITTSYGNAWRDKNWQECSLCHTRFTMPVNVSKQECPLCKSNQIKAIKN